MPSELPDMLSPGRWSESLGFGTLNSDGLWTPATRKSKPPRSGTYGGPQSGGAAQAVVPVGLELPGMLSPEGCRESLGGWSLNSDGLWTPLVVATVNQR